MNVMNARITPYALGFATLVTFGCSASPGDDARQTSQAVSAGQIFNFGTLVNPGSCMDAQGAGTTDGTQIQEWVCNGTGAQSFALQDAGNGAFNVVNTNAGKCVDISGAGTADGTKVQLWDCNGTGAQTFVLQPTGSSGFVNIINTHSNKCLDVQYSNPASGTVVQLWGCDGTNAQVWNPTVIGQESSGGSSSSSSGSSSGGGSSSGSSSGGTVSTCGATVNPGDRVITVTNECPGQTINIGVNGGYVQDCDNGACPAGSTCSTNRSPPGCFWDFPTPACGSPVLASGATATYVLPAPQAGSTVTWSGNVYAATQCASNGSGCATAQCATSLNGQTVIQACPDGMGPQGPTTLAEFTLVPDGSDFYDVSAINGVNVPVSMGPLAGTADPSNPYTCATAGATTGSPGLLGCSWSFNPSINATDESALLRAVTPGGASCSSDADCSGGQVCGTALSFGSASGAQSCGTQVAWWTADELCAYTGNAEGGPIACNQGVAGQGTNGNLYGCNGANATSGYNTAATSTSCGCPDWNIDGQALAVPPGFSCYANNPAWQSIAEPWAAFLKNACPTAYSFPFDDATSTFTCATANTSVNGTGYAITFCPGGNTGL
jgi:hypothetical protein